MIEDPSSLDDYHLHTERSTATGKARHASTGRQCCCVVRVCVGAWVCVCVHWCASDWSGFIFAFINTVRGWAARTHVCAFCCSTGLLAHWTFGPRRHYYCREMYVCWQLQPHLETQNQPPGKSATLMLSHGVKWLYTRYIRSVCALADFLIITQDENRGK